MELYEPQIKDLRFKLEMQLSAAKADIKRLEGLLSHIAAADDALKTKPLVPMSILKPEYQNKERKRPVKSEVDVEVKQILDSMAEGNEFTSTDLNDELEIKLQNYDRKSLRDNSWAAMNNYCLDGVVELLKRGIGRSPSRFRKKAQANQ